MKTLYYRLMMIACAVLTLCACAEDTLSLADGGEGEEVTLQLSYRRAATKDVVVTRATSAENALNNLQIFIFDSKDQLKGYKYVEQDELVQDGTVGTVNVKTVTGQVRIYAVANAKTAIYNMETAGTAIPTASGTWAETDAQRGRIPFTLSDLKAIAFQREAGEKDITEANFLMSGTANGGELCTLVKGTGGMASIAEPAATSDQLIRLRRIVAKVTFNVKTGQKAGRTIEFTPTSYSFYNVPQRGSLIEGAGIVADGFENFTGGSYSAQTPGVFEAYLPENLQEAQNSTAIVNWNDREADSSTETLKTFTNAPASGTYVVLDGTYVEKTGSVISRDATVKYFIHLGDFSSDLTDFSVKRNYHYTYNVTVNGVDSIVVQVDAQNDDVQPGAEGIVFDYDTGTSYTLDSHYDYCVMQFNRDEIAALKRKGYGYTFKVKALDTTGTLRESGKIIVTGSSTLDADQQQELNDADLDWVRFLKGGTYNQSASHGGADPGYAYLREQNNLTDHTQTNVGMNVVELLAHLYDLDYNSSEWDSNGNITYTCYVNENYYDSLAWGKYVNIDPRILYIANEVNDSQDKRSVHATVKYVVQQYSIKTFYNTDYDGSIIAYGLETIRDDHKYGADNPGSVTSVQGSDRWNGMANMKKDLAESNSNLNWDDINYQQIKLACMSRNRDLNGDGHIDDDELRWYLPAIDQYAGMWIGENALTDTKVRCYNGVTTTLEDPSTSRRPSGDYLDRTGAEHYFSNTSGIRVFWAEEGMATGNENGDTKLRYVRCIRNMKSKSLALNTSPDTYYQTDGRTVDLSRIATSALRTSIQENELVEHTERGVDKNIANSARRFTYARYNTRGYIAKNGSGSNTTATGGGDGYATMESVVTDAQTLCAQYSEDGTSTGWRAPNQRELCMMYILGAYNADSWEGCRTHFTGDQIRYSWVITSNLNMDNNDHSRKVSLRCVRDTK